MCNSPIPETSAAAAILPSATVRLRLLLLTAALAALVIAPQAGSRAPNHGGRLFGPKSPFNVPIARAAPTDPRSQQYIPGLLTAARHRGFTIAAYQWTVPVYWAGRSTPRTTVRLTAPWSKGRQLAGVPMPTVARPDSQRDAHMMVLDRRAGCEYDFWGGRRNSDGSWSASWANAIPISSRGIYVDGASARASGFALGAGLLFPRDFRRGAIDHALFFSYPYTRSGGPVAPATWSDGRPDSESGRATGSPALPSGALPLPEGARLQLDPKLNLRPWKLSPWQRMVARALQRYGMILGDTGGAVGLAAASGAAFPRDPYSGLWRGGTLYPAMPVDLISHMRVLKMGPQHPVQPPFRPTRCARFIRG